MIRTANQNDLEKINAIYNQAVEAGFCTAHIEPVSLAYRENWFADLGEEYPVFVFHSGNEIIGWLSVTPYKAGRAALDEVAEVSYYIDFDHHSKGIGTDLMKHAMDFCEKSKFRIVVAILMSGNEASLGLLQKFGFEEYGRIPDAIHYRGEFRDHLYFGKTIKSAETT